MRIKCSVPLPCLLINMMTKEKARDSIAYILGFKPVKTARHRVLVIVSHLFLWGLFLAMPLLIYRIRILDNTFIYRELVTKSFLVILFYINYYYLLPRFFQRRKVANYFLSITAALLLLCVVNIVTEYFFREHLRANAKHYILTSRMGPGGRMITVKDSVTGDGFFTQALPAIPAMPTLHVAGANYQEPTMVAGTVNLINDDTMRRRMHMWKQYFHTRHPQDTMIEAPVTAVAGVTMPAGMRLFRGGPLGERGIFWMGFSMVLMNTLSSGVIILLISGFIKLANSFIISEKQKKALENERLNAELNFLKLQINPHFLFNTLNSIYSQAHLKSEQTEYSILKFSQIMRYVLYDSTTEKIPLKKDLEYIRNYIDLQKLRISKNITIQYAVTGLTSDLLIAPLLLITFIENAFKHGISYSSPSAIDIKIGVTGTDLTLTVGNTIIRHPSYSSERAGGGVGLVNARRRLDVLYPGRYLLDISDNNSIYVVNLKISLDHEADRDQIAHI
jgi:two-component system, LytTR family, sensor kinase